MHKIIWQQLKAARCFSYKSVQRPDFAALAQTKTQSKQLPVSTGSLAKQLKARILATGPITLADYMREVLTNPQAGYYMHRDVFGREGDFITSPEISQIFGELVAIWVLEEWRKLGSPTPFQIVELGPGRGSLARDMLKVLTQFKLAGQFSMHLVEISPALSQIQAQRFCYKHELLNENNNKLPYYQVGETASKTPVLWYKHLQDVPKEFSIVLAHEFFDALPVHKLQLADDGVWKEVLVDIEQTEQSTSDDADIRFRFVLSNTQTALSRFYRPIEGDTRQCLEYSVETDRHIAMLAERFERDGGFGLIMDYGHFGNKTDTFRAFRQHQLHDPLRDVGTADLTADADFRQIKHIAELKNQVICFGPVTQAAFLQQMQGEARLQQLLQHAPTEQASQLKSGYAMLTDPKQMGERFKFFSIFPAVLKEHLSKYPVNGFQ